MRREWFLVGALWAALTALGELLVWGASIFPGAYAREADVSDSAFRLLMRLAVPVFTFVVAMLVVGLARFRARGAPPEDGSPRAGNGAVYAAWLGVTSALAVVLIVNPGLVGLADIRGEPGADMVVRVEGAQWFWTISYPDEGVSTTRELVLPVGNRVRFEVTSTDVIHSFWIPAFRVKIDAVPGRTTVVHATPTRTGSFETDFNLRLQCAELCGIGHAAMAIPVRVVGEAEFEAWLRGQAEGGGECAPSGTELHVAAQNVAFDTACLAAPAGRPFTVVFRNADARIPHNVSIARDQAFEDAVFIGEIFNGPDSRTYRVDALPPGRYFFRCDVHPVAMFGTFVVAQGG